MKPLKLGIVGVAALTGIWLVWSQTGEDLGLDEQSSKPGAHEKVESGQSIPDCDATALKEGRPLKETPGCMVPLEGGKFRMGAQNKAPGEPGYDELAEADEGPVHEVEISSFWLHMYEVSVREFRRCIKAGVCHIKDVQSTGGYFNYRIDGARSAETAWQDEGPMNGVTWFGARDYCAWIGARLPTEAEWEYAARGGKRELRFPWEPQAAPTCQHLVFKGGADQKCGYRATRRTNSRMPLGEHPTFYVVHLAGNVWEWVADWYAEDYYEHAPSKNPQGPEEGEARVHRGGGWTDHEDKVFRTTYRAQMPPGMQLDDVGFRCATESIY